MGDDDSRRLREAALRQFPGHVRVEAADVVRPFVARTLNEAQRAVVFEDGPDEISGGVDHAPFDDVALRSIFVGDDEPDVTPQATLQDLQSRARSTTYAGTSPVSDNMVRSIQQSLRAEGHEISEAEVRAACERMLARGGK